jgi:hypothetical protein
MNKAKKKLISIFLLIFSLFFVLLSGCSVEEKVLDFGPINGYLNFQQVHFATADDNATVILVINCYSATAKNDSDIHIPAYRIANKIVEELNDVAAKVKIPTYQMSLLTDSTVSATITTTDYNQISSFVNNIRSRLGEMSTTYNVKSNIPEFGLVFTHGHHHNEVLFRYSRFLFAENSAIIFESQNGNVRYSPKENTQTLRIQTITYNEIDYLANKSPLDKDALNEIEELRFSCDQKELSWWDKLFSSESDDLPKKDDNQQKTIKPAHVAEASHKLKEGFFWKAVHFVGNWIERPFGFLSSITTLLVFIFGIRKVTRS